MNQVQSGEQGKLGILGLTLHQPWCWAIASGPKRVENRTWAPPIPVGTWLALHAGLTYDREGGQWIWERFRLDIPVDLPKGAICAVARFAGTVTASADPWFFGPVGWLLDPVVPIEPVPCRGAQKLWRLPDDVRALIKERYRAAVAQKTPEMEE